MAGAILGAMHGESVIDPADKALLDAANQLDLTVLADRFTQTAAAILESDRKAEATRAAQRSALLENASPAKAIA
jgi:hypothetical protein